MSKNGKGFLSNDGLYRYQDMIELPHHVSKTHARMPVKDRAAQFAPFAALSGHHEAVKETARLTDDRIELDEYCKAGLDRKLKEIRRRLGTRPRVSVTYFLPDSCKEGGSYATAEGCVKKLDEYERILILEDGVQIRIDDMIEIKELSRTW